MTEEKKEQDERLVSLADVALTRFKGNPITLTQTADLLGMSEDEKKYIEILKSEWIYFSYEMVRKWFMPDATLDQVRQNYSYMRVTYGENVDWKYVDVSSDWVREKVDLERVHEFSIRTGNKNGGINSKYHAITHKCFKGMCDKHRVPDKKDKIEKVERVLALAAVYATKSEAVETSDVALMRRVRCSDETKTMLAQMEYKEVTYDVMATKLEFTEDQMRMLKMFWDPAFNNGWIYLDDDIILTQMTNEKGKNALGNFFKLLKAEYKENVDYKKIKANDELIKIYESMIPAGVRNRKNKATSNRKLYYAVTGETYKDLLMRASTKKGKDSRDYYRKVERLAMLMRDYITALHQYLMAKSENELRTKLAEEKAEAVRQTRRAKLVDAFTEHFAIKENTGSFYIATSRAYAAKNFFKLGITTDLPGRLRQYNCERPASDMMYYAYIFECHEPKQIENKLKFLLKAFNKKNPKKGHHDENYSVPYRRLKRIVELVCEHHSEEVEVLNEIINNFTEEFLSESTIPDAINITPETAEEVTALVTTTTPINMTTLTDEAKKELAKTILTEFIQENQNIPDYDFETCKDNLYVSEDEKEGLPLQVVWKDLSEFLRIKLGLPKNRFKRTEWNNVFKNLTSDANGIKYKMRS